MRSSVGRRSAQPLVSTALTLVLVAGTLTAAEAPAGAAAPVADVGGPYAIVEGEDLTLDGSGSTDPDTDALTYAWDVDGDGQYDDAFGPNPTVAWADLVTLGLGDDAGGLPIGLEVDDGAETNTDSTSLEISNAAPTISLKGHDEIRAGEPYTLGAQAVDPGDDTVTSWTVSWGDGTIDTFSGPPNVANHTYTTPGLTHDVVVTVTDEDGVWFAGDIATADFDAGDRISRFDANTGALLTNFAGTGGAILNPRRMTAGPDGLIYVSGVNSDTVARFDPGDNSFVGTFVTAGSGGVDRPRGLTFGPDGHLYVASGDTGEVLRYDGTTGAFIDVFVASGTLTSPDGLLFAPDGRLYVTDQTGNDIERYNGTTGGPEGTFAGFGAGARPTGIAIGPNGNLFVALTDLDRVEEVDGTTGAVIGPFATTGLSGPAAVRFGPDGALWVSDYSANAVRRFDGTTGADLGVRVSRPAPFGPLDIAFLPDLQVTVGATAIVNSTADTPDAVPGDHSCSTGIAVAAASGPQCTLRAAIQEANASALVDTIDFAIPGTGVRTIAPATPLPAITGDVSLDATSQPGFSATPVIELDGSAAGPGDGLHLDAAVTVRGLAITGFTGTGIVVSSGAGSMILGNHIGVDPTGLVGRGNTEDGILVEADDVRIGSPAPADRNVISANGQDGVEIDGSAAARTVVEGNSIGTDRAGLADLGNNDDGIQISTGASAARIGGLDPGAGNVISGNGGNGIVLTGTDTASNHVVGNLIGVDTTGITALPNDNDGVLLDDNARGNEVGPGNTISGNTPSGIRIAGGAQSNDIIGNTIGLGSDGDTVVANGFDGIEVAFDAGPNTIGGVGAGNVISGNTGAGILAEDADQLSIVGNTIGLDAAGGQDRGNSGNGIMGRGTDIVIGGNSASAGNTISGNGGRGIWLDSAPGAEIGHNQIGTDRTGSTAIPNDDHGILSGGNGTRVHHNVVSGNGRDGIQVTSSSSGVVLERNRVGVQAAALAAVPNGGAGIRFFGTDGTIGGIAGEGNVIAHNDGGGLLVGSVATGNSILGNSIVGNTGLGIDLGLDGVTANSSGDTHLDYPEIVTAVAGGGLGLVDLRLDLPLGDYRIEVFANPSGVDPTGHGEGEVFLGASTISHGGTGTETFQILYPGTAGEVITLTATEESAGPDHGATSEFSETFTVLVPSVPTAHAGGPYTVAEGTALDLDGTGSTDPDNDALSYGWDLDGDGDHTDVTGPTPTIPWATLVTFGLDDDGTHPISLEVYDGNSTPDTDGVDLTITNTAPDLTTSGPANTVVGATYTLDLSASDPGDDTIAGWTINWGDGTIETFAGNPTSVTHRFSDAGNTSNILAAATDEDGTWHESQLLVVSTDTDELLRLERNSGELVDVIGGSGDGLDGPAAVTIGPDGQAYVASTDGGDIRRFDPTVAGSGSVFVASGSGGLSAPRGLDFGPDGHLYVSDEAGNQILRYDGASGAFIDVFVAAGVGGLDTPQGITFGPSDDLFVASRGTDAILRYDGDSGAFVESFAATSPGEPVGVTFGPDADLFVSSRTTNSIHRYHGADGTDLGVYVAAGSGGLITPVELRFGPAGNLFVTDATTHTVLTYDDTGAPAGVHVASGEGGLTNPAGLAFIPGVQVITSGRAAGTPADIVDPSVRRSDLRAAGGISLAPAVGVSADALSLSGGSQRLLGPAVDITTPALTMTGWIQRGSSSGAQRIVAKSASPAAPIYELYVDGSTDELVAHVRVGGAVREARGGTLVVGTWHHVAGVWDGSTLQVHVDGISVGSVAAGGALAVDPNVPVTIGNVASGGAGFVGQIDGVRVEHRAATGAELATAWQTQIDPSSTVSVGGAQTGLPQPWATSGTETRSGSFALEAPTTAAGATAWATAIGIDEPGVLVDAWWWVSATSGIDVATGVRAGPAPADQWETARTSDSGWDLGRTSGSNRTQDAAPSGGGPAGVWTKITLRSDQLGDSSVFLDDAEIITSLNQGSDPGSGSIGLRTGLLPGGVTAYVDDVRARRLVTPEPVASLGPLDRN